MSSRFVVIAFTNAEYSTDNHLTMYAVLYYSIEYVYMRIVSSEQMKRIVYDGRHEKKMNNKKSFFYVML